MYIPCALCLQLLVNVFEKAWTWIVGKANISLALFRITYLFSDADILRCLGAGFDVVRGAESCQIDLCS